tara:strand:- start:473 stop:652 length:180 start_codon:yes stop_codon:yes gene_type:complete
MKQNFQAVVQGKTDNSFASSQSILVGGALIFFNLSVMLFVGLYWINPVMHEFISGRPLL